MDYKRLIEVEVNNGRVEDLLNIVVNGHPSIDESHFCFDAIEDLSNMSFRELKKVFMEYGNTNIEKYWY